MQIKIMERLTKSQKEQLPTLIADFTHGQSWEWKNGNVITASGDHIEIVDIDGDLCCWWDDGKETSLFGTFITPLNDFSEIQWDNFTMGKRIKYQ